MNLDDRPVFAEAMADLAKAHRLRLKSNDFKDLVEIYMQALEHATLDAVLAAVKVCRDRCRAFPKIVDLLDALPPTVTVAADLRWMGVEEAREYLRAEGLHYEDTPCACLLCQAAHVTDQPLRFVPDFVADNNVPERAFCPAKNIIVTPGHWAHGDELARWYAARDHFFGLYARVARSRQIPRVLELVGASREPGEEG